VVVDDLHVLCVSALPDEADAVLIVDPDAVLAPPVAGQCFESVSRKRRQVAEFASRVELLQLSLGYPRNDAR
jgi:hypothetical protein